MQGSNVHTATFERVALSVQYRTIDDCFGMTPTQVWDNTTVSLQLHGMTRSTVCGVLYNMHKQAPLVPLYMYSNMMALRVAYKYKRVAYKRVQ